MTSPKIGSTPSQVTSGYGGAGQAGAPAREPLSPTAGHRVVARMWHGPVTQAIRDAVVEPIVLGCPILEPVAWAVEVTEEFARWARELRKLDRDSSRQVGAAVELLKEHGPSLKRPLVGEITTSKIKNMKELRPGSTGRSEIRILFVFDPWQQIVLLVAGDKADDWRDWYRKAIPRAEQLYAEHVEVLSVRRDGGR